MLGVLAISMSASATHFVVFDGNTGNTMNVEIKPSTTITIDGRAMAAGDEIGVFDSLGICCGAGAFASGNSSIAVFGQSQNPQDTQTDGMGAKELLRWRVWDGALGKELLARATYILVDPGIPAGLFADSLYSEDHVSELATLTSIPSAVLPRPVSNANADFFTTSGSLNYSLLRAEPVNIGIFDLLGRCALTLSKSQKAGAYRIGLRSLNLPSGQYVIRFTAGGFTLQQPLTIANPHF